MGKLADNILPIVASGLLLGVLIVTGLVSVDTILLLLRIMVLGLGALLTVYMFFSILVVLVKSAEYVIRTVSRRYR